MKWRLKTDSGCLNQFQALDSQALWEFFFRQDAVAGFGEIVEFVELVKLVELVKPLFIFFKTPECYTDKIKRRWEASAIASEKYFGSSFRKWRRFQKAKCKGQRAI